MHVLLSAGSNAQGQLGNASTDDSHSFQRCSFLGCEQGVLPAGTSRIVSLSGGANHTVVLLEVNDTSSDQPRRELWGCGSGLKGQLGPTFSKPTLLKGSSPVFRPIILPLEQHNLGGRSYKAVCTAWETTYVVLERPGTEDAVISMGANDFGDLGVGGYKQQEKTLHVINFDHVEIDGHSPKPDTIVVLNLSAGQHHVVGYLRAVFSDSSLRSFLVGWGSSRHGQLDDLSSDDKRSAAQPFTSKPKLISTSEDIIGLGLGMQHTVLLHTSRRASGTGSNRKGQLLGLQSLSNVRCVACTWNGTYAVVDEDPGTWHVVSTGSNTHGQLGRLAHNNVAPSITAVGFPEIIKTRVLKEIACGSEHVLCLFSTSVETLGRSVTEVWGWGWNEHGNLGLDTTDDVHIPVRILPTKQDNTFYIVDVWAGCGTSWIYGTDAPG